MAADEQSTPPDPKVHQDSEEPHPQGQASDSADDAPGTPRYIAGIGASAGGLDALNALLQAMPTDTGVAFVIVTHMDPNHNSLLPELLQRHTELKVVQAEDGCTIAADTVYIIPPGQNMSVVSDRLELIECDSPSYPIDYFLRSLAESRKAYAISVILTGTGSDGTLGTKAIKENLGLTICQDPAEALHSGMPESAVRTGMVDYAVPVSRIPDHIISYVQSRRQAGRQGQSLDGGHLTDGQLESLQKVFFHLRSKTGHDFSAYKKSTILRRIERRMHVHQISGLDKYARYMQEHPEEARSLFKELLIGVTSFFRDPEAFEVFKSEALPQLLKESDESHPIRVWVPGTATGEEAYSVTIAIHEYLQAHENGAEVQVFATDIDEEAIETARQGRYPGSIAEDVSAKRLKRYFTSEDDSYRIKREIREMVIFAVQDIAKDPPFTSLDLICCRNLLIYLNSELQHRIIPLFHYSLRDGGVLFLGSSESVGEFTDLFESMDSRWKLFRRRSNPEGRRAPLEFGVTGSHRGRSDRPPLPRDAKVPDSIGQTLLNTFTPPSAVIHRNGDIVYIHGRTGRYLEPAAGRMNVRITDMAREGLATQLPSMLRKAINTNSLVRRTGVRIKTNDSYSPVTVAVRPLPRSGAHDLFLVTFEEDSDHDGQGAERSEDQQSVDDRGKDADTLRRELKDTRDSLQSTVEELETSNEELRSMNEEYQSTNEELKSANEELETSREELQSLNEELNTVNRELEDKVTGLTEAHAEMQSFLDSLDTPTMFVDTMLRIKRFTRQAVRVINVTPSDIGRPLTDLTTKLRDNTMTSEARAVLEDIKYREREVQTEDGHWFLRRTAPYRRSDDTIEGVVIHFVDINELKERTAEVSTARGLASRAEEFLDAVFETVNEGLLILNSDMEVLRANPAFYRIFKLRREVVEGRRLDAVGAGHFVGRELMESLADVLPEQRSFDEFAIEREFTNIGKRRLIANARPIPGRKNREEMILLGIKDVTKG